MATLKFHTLDVFTDRRFTGNPLAVVLDADGLADEQMQAIAREFNLSETVFVQSSERPAHSAKMRIFTPHSEVPFAGHPTIGTATLLAELNAPTHNGEQDALIVLEQAIGTVRVGVRTRPGCSGFRRVRCARNFPPKPACSRPSTSSRPGWGSSRARSVSRTTSRSA